MKLYLFGVSVLIVILELTALAMGHNGAMFASAVGGITAIAGYQIGKGKKPKTNTEK